MGFFTTPSSRKKRKREGSSGPVGRATKKVAPVPSGRRKRVEDEEISSDDGGDGNEVNVVDGTDEGDEDEGEFAGETAADKRRRLALQYLENTRAELGTFNIVMAPFGGMLIIVYRGCRVQRRGYRQRHSR